ncbi:MAG: multidrug effflux MFS transporter [Alphaproteobacteria bacterium]|nr:multidrug effflux MFS transporter [Alphaproteobacteria bacterium]
MLRPDSFALIAALGALAALAPLSNDIYLVSLPSMTEAFAAGVGRVQLTLTAFVAGFAIGQYAYGPLSDRFGRRPLMLAGLALYVAASVAAAIAATVEVLIAARFVQAIGMSSGPVLGRAVVRDLYDRESAARLLSYMAVVAGFAPVVAPIIGSQLHVAFGWRANFIFVALYGAVALAVVAWQFDETNRRLDPEALRLRRMAGNIGTLLSSRLYLGYALTASCVGSGLFAFISGSPFVFLQVLGFAAADFGYLFAFCMCGYLVGSWISGRFVLRLGMDRLLRLGVVLALAGGLSMAGLAALHLNHVAAILGPMFVFMFAFALILPQAMAGALTPFPQIAGSASSLIGLCQYGLSAIVGTAVAALFDGSALPMAAAIGVMAVLAALAYAALVRPART